MTEEKEIATEVADEMQLIPIIKTEVQPLVWNFEEMKAALTRRSEKYVGLIVTEDNLIDSEKTLKEIRKANSDIDKFRKEYKSKLEAPAKEFDSQCKELQVIVKGVEFPLGEQIAKFEQQRRDDKAVEVKTWIVEAANAAGLEEKFAQQLTVDDKYLNRNQSNVATKRDLTDRANKLKAAQDNEKALAVQEKEKHDALVETCRAKSESLHLLTPVKLEELIGVEDLPLAAAIARIDVACMARANQERKAKEAAEAEAKAKVIEPEKPQETFVKQPTAGFSCTAQPGFFNSEYPYVAEAAPSQYKAEAAPIAANQVELFDLTVHFYNMTPEQRAAMNQVVKEHGMQIKVVGRKRSEIAQAM